MKIKDYRLLLAVLGMGLLSTAGYTSPPPRPSSFFGAVTAGSGNAPAGTLVSAWINGVKYAEATVFAAEGLSVYRLTNAWRNLFPYSNQAGYIAEPSLEAIITAATRIYAGHPELLKAIFLALL